MRLKLPFFLLLLALLGASEVSALGLGQITVRSRLGARFHAEVELLANSTDIRPIAECFRLSLPTDLDAGIPALTQARLSIEQQHGKPRLLIISDQPVSDPILLVSLRAGCGSEVVRDYVLIIDPAEARTLKPAPLDSAIAGSSKAALPATGRPTRKAEVDYPESWQVGQDESARSIAGNLFPNQTSAQRRFLKALQAANNDVDFGSSWDTLLAAGTQLIIPDTRRQTSAATIRSRTEKTTPVEPAPALPGRDQRVARTAPAGDGSMSDRLNISGNSLETEAFPDGLPLRLATELSSQISARTTENQRSILRLEYRLLATIYDQARQQLELAEQVRGLESSVAELQTATENSTHPVLPSDAPAALAASPTLIPEADTRETRTALPDRRTIKEPLDYTLWGIGLAALLGVTALIVWMLRRYSSRTMPEALSPAPENPPLEKAPALSIASQTPHIKEQTAYHAPNLNDGKNLVQQQPMHAPDPASTHGTTVLTEQYEFNPVMELADIMLAFGRVKGATEALLDYIQASPDGALQPWLKLIDIYRQGEMRQDYEELAQKLNLHFNVAATDWEELSNLTLQQTAVGDEEAAPFETLLLRLPNIGQISHIRDEITRTWGTPEGLAYLNKLLRDNRKGSRKGFTLPTVSELLFLFDILEKRLNNTKNST